MLEWVVVVFLSGGPVVYGAYEDKVDCVEALAELWPNDVVCIPRSEWERMR